LKILRILLRERELLNAGFTNKIIQNEMGELLEIENLTKFYTSGYVLTEKKVAVDNVSFSIKKSEVFCLVGESGSGKTTIGNIVLRLLKPTSGKILLDGRDIYSYDKKTYWRKVQAVFQDPYSSFNFFYTIDKPLHDAFHLLEKRSSREERKKVIKATFEKIGMNPDEIMGRYPHQLSGGQMQRILIARSFILHPELLVADEPTSMVDASTRVSVLNELLRLKEEEELSVLFITHDLAQAYYIGNRIAIMQKGKIVESGLVEEVIFEPKHPYTKDLIRSVPPLHEKWKL
jgi:peptide/nickel transport system ATP-binding protein